MNEIFYNKFQLLVNKVESLLSEMDKLEGKILEMEKKLNEEKKLREDIQERVNNLIFYLNEQGIKEAGIE